MSRIIMHIDVNNAFLSWSAIFYLQNGSKVDIRDTYAVIGGDEQKRSGVVLAKSNPAKKMGVVTGESLYSARKKCPKLETYPSNYPFYEKMSHKLFTLISNYTPDIEIASIDECYLDFTKVLNLYKDPLEFAKKIQKEVNEKLGFTINIGIANNKLCAKMASDFSKPNKIHTLYDDEIEEKMWPLIVDDLFGVGKKTAEVLHSINIHTIKDLANADVTILYPYFKNQSTDLINKARGIDFSEVESEASQSKGISNEITLEKDYKHVEDLDPYVLSLSEKVSLRLRSENRYTSTISVILKNNQFKRRSHQKKLTNPTNSTQEIYKVSKRILKEMWNEDEVRLIGISLTQLTAENIQQILLFEDQNEQVKNQKLDKALDQLKNKYGKEIIKNAGSIELKDRDHTNGF